MDKNEQILKMEELKVAMRSRDFEKAAEIAEQFDVKKIKDNNFLSLMADAYELTHNYQEAKKILLNAYDNTNAGRHFAYRLCLIATKTKEFDEAGEFYEDFVEMAPRDTARYILKYKMAKAQEKPVEELIGILEEYIHIDMEEKWAYELAKLYHIAGDEEKCVALCDEISLWFSEGKYVSKAMDLKKKYKELTPAQQQKYDGEINESQSLQAKQQEEEQEKAEIEEADMQEQSAPQEEIIQEESALQEEDNVQKEPALEEDDTMQEQHAIEGTEPAEQEEQPVASEPIKDIQGVENILRQLQERGILKAETVQQAVHIMDESGKRLKEEEEIQEENISTTERWAEDNAPIQEEIQNLEDMPFVEEKEISPDEEETKENTPKVPEGATKMIPGEQIKKVLSDETPERQESKQATKVVPKIENDNINAPVLDLSFDSPQRDTSNDVGQENMYESIVTNSTLGRTTDQLPTKEEIDEAIKNAQLHVQENPSAKIEILSGVEEENKEKPVEQSAAEVNMEKDFEQAEVNQSETDVWQMEKEEHSEKEEVPEESIEEEAPVQEEMPKEENVIKEESQEQKMVLTEQDLAPFKNYLNVEGLETNLREIANDLVNNYHPNGKSTDGNIIIRGNEQTGKTTLAIEIIKLVNRKRGRRNRKLAKIDATALNRRGFRNSLNKLVGCDLIVENANELGAMTLSELIDATGMFTDDMLIVLEGDNEGMEALMQSSPRMTQVFNHVIQIREYDIKEWVEYGKKYALQKGYVVDELANLAFFKTVDDFFGIHKGISQGDVEDIVEQAISKSHRFGRKVKGIFSSQKDEEGMKILVESDFSI